MDFGVLWDRDLLVLLRVQVSVPMVLEYEQVAKRRSRELGLDPGDIDDVLDYLCQVAVRHEIYYLWRPVLRDPGDDAHEPRHSGKFGHP